MKYVYPEIFRRLFSSTTRSSLKPYARTVRNSVGKRSISKQKKKTKIGVLHRRRTLDGDTYCTRAVGGHSSRRYGEFDARTGGLLKIGKTFFAPPPALRWKTGFIVAKKKKKDEIACIIIIIIYNTTTQTPSPSLRTHRRTTRTGPASAEKDTPSV